MPGGDGTGPVGQGPMTGRATGFCTGSQTPEFTNPGGIGYGRGLGFGRGRGRGFGRGFWGHGRRFWYRDYHDTPFNKPGTEEEKTYLENMIKSLDEEIKSIRDRLQEISKEKKETS